MNKATTPGRFVAHSTFIWVCSYVATAKLEERSPVRTQIIHLTIVRLSVIRIETYLTWIGSIPRHALLMKVERSIHHAIFSRDMCSCNEIQHQYYSSQQAARSMWVFEYCFTLYTSNNCLVETWYVEYFSHEQLTNTYEPQYCYL